MHCSLLKYCSPTPFNFPSARTHEYKVELYLVQMLLGRCKDWAVPVWRVYATGCIRQNRTYVLRTYITIIWLVPLPGLFQWTLKESIMIYSRNSIKQRKYYHAIILVFSNHYSCTNADNLTDYNYWMFSYNTSIS